MKIIITILCLFISCKSFALTGNELHELFEKNEKNAAARYIQGLMDMQWFIASAIRGNEKLNSIPTVCAPSGATYGQGIDLIQKYLKDHPESRNNEASMLGHNALIEVWRCPAE